MVIMTEYQEITVFPEPDALFQFAANDFKNRAIAAVAEKGNFSVVLAGGNTPKAFFDVLTSVEEYKKHIPWPLIQFFFGDERYVPADHEESNYHMADLHLFSKVPIDPSNIYRIPTEFKDPKIAAKHYENTLRKTFHISDQAFPLFDLVYLGLGDNAHTASLMPLSELVKHFAEKTSLESSHQLVATLSVSESILKRITLTPNALNHGRVIIFLATGASKATAAWEVLEGKSDPEQYPAQLIRSVHGKTIWYLDQLAAAKLSRKGLQDDKQ